MIDMAAHIRGVVEKLGPPTPEQIARIRVILWGPLPFTAVLPVSEIPEQAADAA